jgi:hypothetical protein
MDFLLGRVQNQHPCFGDLYLSPPLSVQLSSHGGVDSSAHSDTGASGGTLAVLVVKVVVVVEVVVARTRFVHNILQ